MSRWAYLGAVAGGASGYSIVFLDLPGCASCGDTLEETLAMGREALEGYLEVSRDYGDPIPMPTVHTLANVEDWLYDVDDVEREPWVGLFPIEARFERDPDQVPVTLPRTLLSEIDAAMPDARRFIIEATRRELERLKKSA